LDPQDSAAIRKGQETFNNNTIVQDLAYIESNFSILPNAIKRLEAQGLSMAEALDILAEVIEALGGARGEIGEIIRQKFIKVRDRNPGLGQLIDIAKILTGGQAEIDLAPSMIAAMKFAPMQSCDVERSFSAYKNILADRRTSFTPENLEMVVICNCEKRG
jgi:hypothetical protein